MAVTQAQIDRLRTQHASTVASMTPEQEWSFWRKQYFQNADVRRLVSDRNTATTQAANQRQEYAVATGGDVDNAFVDGQAGSIKSGQFVPTGGAYIAKDGESAGDIAEATGGNPANIIADNPEIIAGTEVTLRDDTLSLRDRYETPNQLDPVGRTTQRLGGEIEGAGQLGPIGQLPAGAGREPEGPGQIAPWDDRPARTPYTDPYGDIGGVTNDEILALRQQLQDSGPTPPTSPAGTWDFWNTQSPLGRGLAAMQRQYFPDEGQPFEAREREPSAPMTEAEMRRQMGPFYYLSGKEALMEGLGAVGTGILEATGHEMLLEGYDPRTPEQIEADSIKAELDKLFGRDTSARSLQPDPMPRPDEYYDEYEYRQDYEQWAKRKIEDYGKPDPADYRDEYEYRMALDQFVERANWAYPEMGQEKGILGWANWKAPGGDISKLTDAQIIANYEPHEIAWLISEGILEIPEGPPETGTGTAGGGGGYYYSPGGGVKHVARRYARSYPTPSGYSSQPRMGAMLRLTSWSI